jgi:recombination protein RecR
VAGLIAPVARLIEEFSKLPGIGTKTAQRLTYHVLRGSSDDARGLAAALVAIKEQVAYCSVCCNITETGVDPCDICADPRRDAAHICVVEEPLDVLAIERTSEYRGRYHVLHGAISPIDGIGPERLRTRELVARVAGGGVEEVILATNPNLEGEATAMYLADLLAPHVPSVTRIARGLPVGGDLEYADDVTLIRSLQGRRAMER